MPILTNNIQDTRSSEKGSGRKYWGGFAAGAAIGTAATVAAVAIANITGNRYSRILRLEDSVQIGRHVEDVFRAWTDMENLAASMELVNSIRLEGDVSSWEATVDGRAFRWKAQTTQVIPNEAVGWKSVSGPKHSGRITFSPIGEDTIVHVTMNYAPPVGVFSRLLSPFDDHLEGYINQCLRDFKDAMENGLRTQTYPDKASGRESVGRARKTISGERTSVDHTRPQEYKYPTGT